MDQVNANTNDTAVLALNAFAALEPAELAKRRGRNPFSQPMSLTDLLDLAGRGGGGGTGWGETSEEEDGGPAGRHLLLLAGEEEEQRPQGHGRALLQAPATLDWAASGNCAPVVDQGCVPSVVSPLAV